MLCHIIVTLHVPFISYVFKRVLIVSAINYVLFCGFHLEDFSLHLDALDELRNSNLTLPWYSI